MDGNGRWALQRHAPRIMGYHAGLKSVRLVIKACIKANIPILTLFAFSSENWSRPLDEVQFLMNLFIKILNDEVSLLNENGIRLKVLGDRTGLSSQLVEKINQAEILTQSNTQLTLNLALNYGGKWDIVQAAQTLANQVKAGLLEIEDIDINKFEQTLIGPILEPPDLLIRSGGEQRLSNFILWHLAYSELYFTKTLWPDFGSTDFDLALDFFRLQKRRFGGLDTKSKLVPSLIKLPVKSHA